MFRAFFTILLASSAYGAGEFSVIFYPNSISFKGHDQLKESIVPEIYASSLGFTVEEFSWWQGFYIENPFKLPEAIVTIAVDGVKDIGQQKGHHFPLVTNSDEVELYNSMEKRVKERFPQEKSNIVRVQLSNGLQDIQNYEIFEGIKNDHLKHVNNHILKVEVEEDRLFLKEIALLNEIARQIEEGLVKKDNIPDIYWFRSDALHALSDLHGENSTETNEAKHLLQKAILRLTNAFVKAYDERVLVSVITSDVSHTRKTRSILQAEEDQDDKTKYNLASYYNGNYPVMFNIILWFGVVMFFAILAVCLATANMDPGRDSIIYRMTSTRMKKDN